MINLYISFNYRASKRCARKVKAGRCGVGSRSHVNNMLARNRAVVTERQTTLKTNTAIWKSAAHAVTMRIIELVIDVCKALEDVRHCLTEFQGYKSYAVRTVISGWFVYLEREEEHHYSQRVGMKASILLRD